MYSKFKVFSRGIWPKSKARGGWLSRSSPKDPSTGALIERVVTLPRWLKKYSSSFPVSTG